MFSVVQTRFSRLAPHSLELLHGHTCYSNKLNKASLQSLMDSMGGVSSPHCKNPEGDVTIHEAAQQQLISIEAGGGGEGRRTTVLFSHPSWLYTFIRT